MAKTFEEIIKDGVSYASEDSNFYYLKPITHEEYDTTMWKVNKLTKKVEFIDFPRYIYENSKNAKEIDVSNLK